MEAFASLSALEDVRGVVSLDKIIGSNESINYPSWFSRMFFGTKSSSIISNFIKNPDYYSGEILTSDPF